MFELKEIMRQKDSKVFAEILNRLREGNHTAADILKIKERLIVENSINDPMNVPHLFIQNIRLISLTKEFTRQLLVKNIVFKHLIVL